MESVSGEAVLELNVVPRTPDYITRGLREFTETAVSSWNVIPEVVPDSNGLVARAADMAAELDEAYKIYSELNSFLARLSDGHRCLSL